MSRKHFEFWPSGLPHDITSPATNLFYNAEVAAARYPDKPFVIFFETPLTFAEFKDEVERLAGFLQQDCSVGSKAIACCSSCRTARSSSLRTTPSCARTRSSCRSIR